MSTRIHCQDCCEDDRGCCAHMFQGCSKCGKGRCRQGEEGDFDFYLCWDCMPDHPCAKACGNTLKVENLTCADCEIAEGEERQSLLDAHRAQREKEWDGEGAHPPLLTRADRSALAMALSDDQEE